MIHQKTEYSSLDAPFAKKKEDINQGDVVEIMEQAQERPDRFNPGQSQTVVKIKTKNGARYMNLNQKSVNALIDEFKSNDDSTWIGKKGKILLNPTTIGGKKVIVAYLVGQAWELDEYGEPFSPDVQPDPADDIPTVEADEIGEIDASDIPF